MHNKLMDGGKTFEQAQQQLRWTYQYLIVNDFLPRIVGQDVVEQPDPPPRHRPDPVHRQALPAAQRQQALHAGGVLRRRVPLRAQHDPRGVRGAGRAHRADLRPGRLRGPARQPADPREPVDRLELLLRDPRHEHPGRPEHGAADRHAALAAAVQAAVDGRRADGGRDRRAGRAQPAARQAPGPARRPGRRHRDGDQAADQRPAGTHRARVEEQGAAVVLHPQGVGAARRQEARARSAAGSSPR